MRIPGSDGSMEGVVHCRESSSRIEKLLEIRKRVHPFNPRNPASKTGTDRFAMLQARYTPILGEGIEATGEDIELDQLGTECRMNFPDFNEEDLPSAKNGFSFDPLNWAEDYAAVVSVAPIEIFPYELIVGELHERLYTYRKRTYPSTEKIRQLRRAAWALGSGALVWNRTCPNLSFGLKHGWGGILKKMRENREKFMHQGKDEEARYLEAAERTCAAIISNIKRHADTARRLAIMEIDEDRHLCYEKVAQVCAAIAENPPSAFHEAVQWVHFFILHNLVIGDCDGYGRIDQLLLPFYTKDLREGRITHEEARDLIAELFLHLDPWLTVGGRGENLEDATNEVSWLVLEAYDLLKGYPGNFGVMYHSEIDKEFFQYACDILIRRGTGTPSLFNYDVMRESLIHQGIRQEDAWNVSHNGCAWYSVPGKQYLCGDWASVNVVICFMNALKKAFERKSSRFDQLWELYCIEVSKSVEALNKLVDGYLAETPQVWPEMVVSLTIPECIEKGRDISDGAVPYYIATVQMIGLANVGDSLYAVKKLVFEDKSLTLEELKQALDANYQGYERIYELLLEAPKFGNDDDRVDQIAKEVVDQFRLTVSEHKNIRGFPYSPQLWSHVGHVYVGQILGATPDGRKAGKPLAQGGNPTQGRAVKGLTAHAKSMAKLDFRRLNGGSLQLELDPSLLNVESPAEMVSGIVKSYFELGGVHIILNLLTVKDLEKAKTNPDEYGDVVVRVTGFSARFVSLAKEVQNEIIARSRHAAL